MEGHTIVISSNLLNLYTPVEVVNLEDDVEREPVKPQTKLCDWSLTPSKINQRWPAYNAQRKATRKTKQVDNSFTRAEDLEASCPECLLAKEAR